MDINTKFLVAQRLWDRAMQDLPTFLWGTEKYPGFVFTNDEHTPMGENAVKRLPDKEYLRLLVRLYEENPLLIIFKSRQLMVSWLFCAINLWTALHPGRKCLLSCKMEGDAVELIKRVEVIYNHLPEAFRAAANPAKTLFTVKHKEGDSGLYASSQSVDEARSKTFSEVLFDEAPFTPNAEAAHGAIMPTILGGGRFTAVGTPNGTEYTFRLATDEGRIDFSDINEPWVGKHNRPIVGFDAELTDFPQELIPGVIAYKNHNGYTVVLVHYSADPDGLGKEERKLGSLSHNYLRENELSFASFAGQPVYGGEYVPAKHEVPNLPHNPQLPLWLGWDFGYRKPALVIAQSPGDHKLHVLGEVIGHEQTINRFVEDSVIPYIHSRFPEYIGEDGYLDPRRVFHACDVAGLQRSDKSPKTSIQILNEYRIHPRSRKSVIDEGLTLLRNTMVFPDQEFRIDPVHCPNLTAGFRGGYRIPEPTKTNPNPELPFKDGVYDHTQDGLRYLALQTLRFWSPKPKPDARKPGMFDKILAQKVTDRYGLWT